MYKLKLFFIYGVVLSVENVFGQTKVGDACVDQESGELGICASYSSCQSAEIKFELYSISPTYCEQRYDIVCCQQISQRPAISHRKKQPTVVKRISERKCEEYSKPVTRTEQFVLLTADAKPVSLTVANCTHKKNTLILGGVQADPGQYPHMAALGWPSITGYIFKCGGTLISERFVLTAAHCSVSSSRHTDTSSNVPSVVRLGDHDLRDEVEDHARPITVHIKRIITNPNYNYTVYYDISLVELDSDLEFNTFVRPACLWPKQGFDDMETAIVTGWGAIAYGSEQSKVLLKVTIKLFSNEFCEPLLQLIHNRKFWGFKDSQMCAGDLSGKLDSCQGDSGGPLVLTKPENDCIFYVAGITSFGYPCGRKNSPGVYTRVASFVPWIESVIWS